jgi:hypothetical protein
MLMLDSIAERGAEKLPLDACLRDDRYSSSRIKAIKWLNLGKDKALLPPSIMDQFYAHDVDLDNPLHVSLAADHRPLPLRCGSFNALLNAALHLPAGHIAFNAAIGSANPVSSNNGLWHLFLLPPQYFRATCSDPKAAGLSEHDWLQIMAKMAEVQELLFAPTHS